MSELPRSWVSSTLAGVCRKGQYGWTTRASDEGLVKFLRTTDITKGPITWSSVPYCLEAPPDAGKYLIHANDILISRAGSVGFSTLIRDVPEPTIFASYLIRFMTLECAEPRYIAYFLRSDDYWRQIGAASAGIAVANVNASKLGDVELPVAPLPEQRRIADKLDAVLARVDACRARLDRVPAILRKFREAVLEAAVSGRLTEEWRESLGSVTSTGRDVVDVDAAEKRQMLARYPDLAKKKSTAESSLDEVYVFDIPSTWVFTTWGTASEWVTYGFTRPMPHADDGVPLVTAKDVQNFGVSFERTENTTSIAFANLSDKDRPMEGDLLLTKDGTIGRAALVRTKRPFCINQSVAVVWLRSTTMNRRYLEIVANAGFTQTFIRDKAKGMAIQHLSITDFAQCPLPVPPADEQSEIARRVDELFALADALEAKYRAAVERVERLTPAVLAKAFRGELVAQDPNDEPASVLLERIKMQRASEDRSGLAGRGPGRRAGSGGRGRAVAKTGGVATRKGLGRRRGGAS